MKNEGDANFFFFFFFVGRGGGQIRCVLGDVQVANTRAREIGPVDDAHVRYRISSNNSRPSPVIASLAWSPPFDGNT